MKQMAEINPPGKTLAKFDLSPNIRNLSKRKPLSEAAGYQRTDFETVTTYLPIPWELMDRCKGIVLQCYSVDIDKPGGGEGDDTIDVKLPRSSFLLSDTDPGVTPGSGQRM